MTTPAIKYTSRDFNSIKADLESFIKATKPDQWNEFFASSLGTALIDMVAYTMDILSYSMDVTAQELYLSTARRYESVLRFCRSVGYVPRSVVASSCTLRALELPPAVSQYGAVIDAGATVLGTNGLSYELVEQAIIPAGSTEWLFPVKEGRTHTDTFVPSRASRQEFVTTSGVVAQDSWSVYVGDATDVTNLWEQVDNVSLETEASHTYEVYFDGDGILHVVFGDGNAGAIPSSQVTLKYRTAAGAVANAPIQTISGAFQATLVGSSASVSISVMNYDVPATGGKDRETVEDLRISVPAFIRTLDKVITLRDYVDTLSRIPTVALGHADTPQTSFSGNIVRAYAWASENVDFTATSTSNGMSSTVPYARYIQMPATQIQAIQQYLAPRSMATVHNLVLRPTVAWVDVDLGVVMYNRLLKMQDVHLGITTAIVKVFTDASGFRIRLGDIYAAVMRVPGVLGFQLRRLVFEHLDPSDPKLTLTTDMRQDQDAKGTNGGPYDALVDPVTPADTQRAYYDASYLYDGGTTYAGDIDASSAQAINLRSLVFTLQS